MRIIFLFIMFHVLTGFGCAATSKINLSGDCQPCSVEINPNVSLLLSYDISEIDDEILVKKIRVNTPAGKFVQSLDVKEMVSVIDANDFFLGVLDVNFDGSNDVYLITSRGTSNAYANYWIFDKSFQKLMPAGVFPVFTVHDESKTLSTHENVGSAGREYIRRVYSVIDRKIEPIYEEKQLRDPKTGKFKISKKGNPPK